MNAHFAQVLLASASVLIPGCSGKVLMCDATSSNTGGRDIGAAAQTGGSAGVSLVTGGSSGVTGTTSSRPVVFNSFDGILDTQQFELVMIPAIECSTNMAIANDAGTSPKLEWSGAVDVNADATPVGSMKLTVTFSDWNQQLTVEMRAPTEVNGDPIDLTNRLITVWVRAVAGLSPERDYSYGAEVFVKTGADYVWGRSQWTNISVLDQWIPVIFDGAEPEGVPRDSKFEPTSPSIVGLRLDSGGGGESNYCSADYVASFGPPRTLVLYVDAMAYTNRT